MANLDDPRGFVPVGAWDGGNFRTRVMTKDASDGSAIGINDLVDVDGTANGVTQGTANAEGQSPKLAFIGVARSFGAASTLSTHPVIYLTHGTVLEGQTNDVGIAAADEGLNADIVVAAANATDLKSRMEINGGGEATTNTLDINLLRPVPRVGNDVGSANADWFIRVNRLRHTDQSLALA